MTLEDLVRVLVLSAIEMHRSIETQKNGMILIIDCKGFSMKHAKVLGPTEITKYADIVLVSPHAANLITRQTGLYSVLPHPYMQVCNNIIVLPIS